MWETGLGRDELAEVAAGIGSDVPFLVLGGTALGTGRGETISPVLARPSSWHWVVAAAEGGLSTPDVYAELDRLRAEGAAPPPLGSTDDLLAALRQRNPAVLAEVLGNDLEAATLSLRPELAATLATGRKAGALAGLVCGSGPSCVFLAQNAPRAAEIAAELNKSGTCRVALPLFGPVAGARPA